MSSAELVAQLCAAVAMLVTFGLQLRNFARGVPESWASIIATASVFVLLLAMPEGVMRSWFMSAAWSLAAASHFVDARAER